MSNLLLLAPMGVETRLLRRGAPGARIVRSGIGPRRAGRTASSLASTPEQAVAIAGFAGALVPGLLPGDVVVASQLRLRDGRVLAECPGAEVIAGLLRRRGLRAQCGPIVSVRAPAIGRTRARLAETSGALAVDMESCWLAPAAAGRPLVVARVVLDAPGAGVGIARAARLLSELASVLEEWAANNYALLHAEIEPAARSCADGLVCPDSIWC